MTALPLPQIEVTLWESVTNPQGQRLLADWNAILDLPEWASPPEMKNKMLGRGWSPATFAGDRRLKERVEQVFALVLDYEAQGDQTPTSLDDAAALWSGCHGWIHTTHSHTPETPRFRVVIPLSRSVTAEEYRLVWRWAATRCHSAGHGIDEACRDASRLWLLPVVRPGALAEYRLQPLAGEEGWLDVDAVLEEQRRADAPPPPAVRERREATGEDGAARYVRKALEGALDDLRRAPKGTRHHAIRSRAYHLGGLIHTGAIDAVEIERELMGEAQRCGWDNLDKTRATVRYQIEAGARAPRPVPALRVAPVVRGSSPRAAEPTDTTDTTDGEPPAEDWMTVLVRKRGEVTNGFANVVAFLEHHEHWRGRIRFNEARQRHEVRDGEVWRTWQDTDDTDTSVWFERVHGLRVRPDVVCQAMQSVGRRHAQNPLADYLISLVWDGVARLETWLVRYATAEDTPFVRAAGACWLRSAVARALVPGIKVDAALVLEGAQGAGKSSLLQIIGGEYFTDDIHDLGEKDAAVAMAGAWIVELSELSALGRAELETVKAAIVRQVDRYRPPYGRAMVEQPRRCVFGGTTNRNDYLRDETGNRRWLPVRVGAVDLDALRADRDQLLAEAVASWQAGGPIALPVEVRGAAGEEQAARVESDPWEEQLEAAIRGEREVSVTRLLTVTLGLEIGRVSRQDQTRVARCLVRLGWERRQRRVNGARVWVYVPAGSE